MFYKILHVSLYCKDNAVTKVKNLWMKQRNELCLGSLLCNASFLLCISRKSVFKHVHKGTMKPHRRIFLHKKVPPYLEGYSCVSEAIL